MSAKEHKVHPSVVKAAARIYAECFSTDGKPAHKVLARQMEATIERVIGVTELHNERKAVIKAWTAWSKDLVAEFDRIFPSAPITRGIE